MKIECSDNYVRLGEKSYPCMVSLAMDLIGGKWKTVILYHLQTGEKRFGELHKAMAGVTEMTLSLQLKQLEKDELIERQAYGNKPPLKVVYRLTDFGQTFIPVLEALTAWGNSIAKSKGRFVPTQKAV